MKRILGGFLALVLLLSISCGALAQEERVIRFMTVGDPYVGAIKALLPEF